MSQLAKLNALRSIVKEKGQNKGFRMRNEVAGEMVTFVTTARPDSHDPAVVAEVFAKHGGKEQTRGKVGVADGIGNSILTGPDARQFALTLATDAEQFEENSADIEAEKERNRLEREAKKAQKEKEKAEKEAAEKAERKAAAAQ